MTSIDEQVALIERGTVDVINKEDLVKKLKKSAETGIPSCRLAQVQLICHTIDQRSLGPVRYMGNIHIPHPASQWTKEALLGNWRDNEYYPETC